MIGIWAVLLAAQASVAAMPDSGIPSPAKTAQIVDTDAEEEADSAAYRPGDPVIAAGCSMLLPGAGQIYDRRYLRGALFMLAEGGLIGSSLFWYREAAGDQRIIDGLQDSVALNRYRIVIDSSLGRRDTVDIGAQYRMRADSARHEQAKSVAAMSQTACWALGCYVYSVVDAIDKSGCIRGGGPRSPRRAGLLSAIPGLALGQLYNGKPSKAAMIWMVQSGLALMALNNHRLLREAESAKDAMADARLPDHLIGLRSKPLVDYWTGMRNDAFRERNTYLWYSIFFYLYGIFDAVVDAHLHDYDQRMKLQPDLVPGSRSAGLRLSLAY